MQKSQKYSILLLLWLFLLSSVNFAYAATPGYIGIENNQTFIWNTTYDEGPLKDRREDYGEENDWDDDDIDEYIDELDTNEDLTQLKIVILDVDDEEKDPWGEEGVRIIYNVYFKEEGEDWDLKSKDETYAIWEYDNDFFEYGAGFLILSWKHEYDEDEHEWHDYKYLHTENRWFISTKMDWKEIEEDLEEVYEDDADYDEVSINTDKDANKLEITLDEDEDDEIKEYKWIIDYDDNGVLEYYEWSYDGDPIVIVQTQANQVRQFIEMNLLWIIISAIAIVAGIVVIIVVIKRR